MNTAALGFSPGAAVLFAAGTGLLLAL